ncbi:type II toxin-antitoxin system VapC family toxin [bacterium SCSIO 12844]|nr:type II toxin-antitoxin system VapC family toxin [bacterium SCSIO 12844]
MKLMLDTNICIYIINEKPPHVLNKFKEYKFNEIGISSIVYSELVYGVYKSIKVEKNIVALASFITPLSIVEYDQNAADEYGLIRTSLEKKGKLIGANDLLIAAHAKSLELPLVTNNLEEFSRVDGLALYNWVEKA